MEPDRQSTSVEKTPEGQIRINYDYFAGGVQMSKWGMVFEASAADWVIERLEKAAKDELPEETLSAPPDHLKVYVAGGQRYDDINVNIHNEREETAVYGRLYVVGGMSREVANTLAEQLRKAIQP